VRRAEPLPVFDLIFYAEQERIPGLDSCCPYTQVPRRRSHSYPNPTQPHPNPPRPTPPQPAHPSFQVLIDGEQRAAGRLTDAAAFEPPLQPPRKIPDPSDSKPDDWDEQEE